MRTIKVVTPTNSKAIFGDQISNRKIAESELDVTESVFGSGGISGKDGLGGGEWAGEGV